MLVIWLRYRKQNPQDHDVKEAQKRDAASNRLSGASLIQRLRNQAPAPGGGLTMNMITELLSNQFN